MENTLQKKETSQIGFIEDATSTLEKITKWAELMAQSKLIPDHFYGEKQEGNGQYSKTVTDYAKPNIPAIIMTVQHGLELGLTLTQSLQQVVPVKGIMSVKGDGAKALIFASGIAESWVEHEEGDIDDETYKYSVTAVNKKTGIKKTVSFSVKEAKRADLWITDEKLRKNNRLSYSVWYKYPKRMIQYRAIGFIVRDVFPEVLQGTVTLEEAMDYPSDDKITLTGTDGKEIEISEKTTNKLSQTSDKLNEGLKELTTKNMSDAEIIGIKKEVIDKFTEDELKEMGDNIYDEAKNILKASTLELIKTLPGRKSQKKYRDFILAEQSGEDIHIFYNNYIKSVGDKSEQPVKEDEKPEQLTALNNDDMEPDKTFEPENTESDYEVTDLNLTKKREYEDQVYLYEYLRKKGMTDEKFNEIIAENGIEGYNNLEHFCEISPKAQVEFFITKI